MVSTAQSGESTPAWRPARGFAAARRPGVSLAGALATAVVVAMLGTFEAPLPAAVEEGQARIPIWRLLTMAVAVLPVLALHSPLAELEAVATRRFRHGQRIYLAATVLGSALVFLGGAAIALHPLVLLIIARSWLAWFGLALIAGVLLGWRLAWTLPVLVAVILFYWGFAAGEYRWWEFSARPPDDVASLLLSLALLCAGLIAYRATPWRRRTWRRWRGRSLRPDRSGMS